MKKQSKTKGLPSFPATPSAPTKLIDRNLEAISPLKEQFEPTEGRPIPQHKTMAGAA